MFPVYLAVPLRRCVIPRVLDDPGRQRRLAWAALMRRTWDLDVLACPRCGERLELIAVIEDERTAGGAPGDNPSARWRCSTGGKMLSVRFPYERVSPAILVRLVDYYLTFLSPS